MISAWFLLLGVPVLLVGLAAGWSFSPRPAPRPPFTKIQVTWPFGYSGGDEVRLATYLREKKRGLVHHPDTDAEMKAMRKALRAAVAEAIPPTSDHILWRQPGVWR